MSPSRPGRLAGFDYRGLHKYFVTICVHHRTPVFRELELGQQVKLLLLECAMRFHFAVSAYCVMPDHVHALLEAEQRTCNLHSLMRCWTTRSGHAWRRCHEGPLWQSGYYDHVLRDGESLAGVAYYILENPVRAGLVEKPEDYPLSGSVRYSMAEIVQAEERWMPY